MLKRFLCCLLILFCLTAALAQTPTAPCDCCAKKPDYTNSTYNTSTTSPPPYPWSLFTGQIAIVTQKHPADGGPLLDRVLVIWNLTNQSGAESNLLFDRWWNPTSSPPTHYYSDSRWNYTNLGDVFGLTLDNLGNVYVAATNIYGTGAVGFLSPGSTNAQKSGQIYKIDASGQPTPFGPIPLHLPLQNDSNGLGNIAWDCGHDSLFASNFNDGLIYRLNSAGILNPATWDHGANLPSAVDIHGVPLGRTAIPLGAKDVPSSYAALGRRPWAVRAYKNRLYYSIWSQDSGRTAGAGPNEIWSVALDISGNPVTPARLEITLPVLDSATFNYSNPVSDISFSAGGSMFVAERTMVGNLFPGGIVTGPWAHHSRVLEFGWSAGQWNLVPVATYSLGHHYAIASTYPTNSAGGVDPDWGPGGRVWATGDALHYDYAQDSSTTAPHTPQFSDYIYGIQGLPATGGSVINSILIDTGNSVAAHNKTLIGDVKIPCPECTSPPVIAGPQNTCVSPSHYTISNAQNNVSYTWTVHGGTASATTGSAIDVNWSNTGPYSIVVTTSGPGGCGPVRTAFTVTACPVNSCSYCRDFDTNATLPRPPVSLSGGLEDVKPTVTSNMPGVTSITETVLSASVAYSSPACGVSGPVGAYIPQASQSSPAASNSPVVPISNGNQVIWQSFSGVNFSGGVSTPFHLQLPPPPVLPQPCSANFSFCMSFSLADERCRNCAVIKCFGPFIYGRPISTPETGSVPQPAEQLKPTKKKKP